MIFLTDSKLMELQNFSQLIVDSWFILVLTSYTYHISSIKRRGVHLILVLLGAAFIRGRSLFQKSK